MYKTIIISIVAATTLFLSGCITYTCPCCESGTCLPQWESVESGKTGAFNDKHYIWENNIIIKNSEDGKIK